MNFKVKPLFLIHLVNLRLIVLVDDRTANLQCIGQLSRLHREMVSQEGDTLDLLIISQVLLKNLDGNIAWKDPAQAIRQRERQMQQRLEQAQPSAVEPETVRGVHQQEEAPAFSMEEQC